MAEEEKRDILDRGIEFGQQPVETSTADAAEKEVGVGEMFAEVQEQTGIDIAGLIQSFTDGNLADEAFRAEVMERFEVLIDNQVKIYDLLAKIAGVEVIE